MNKGQWLTTELSRVPTPLHLWHIVKKQTCDRQEMSRAPVSSVIKWPVLPYCHPECSLLLVFSAECFHFLFSSSHGRHLCLWAYLACSALFSSALLCSFLRDLWSSSWVLWWVIHAFLPPEESHACCCYHVVLQLSHRMLLALLCHRIALSLSMFLKSWHWAAAFIEV